MLERLTRIFHSPTPPTQPLGTPDARMALGVLLVRVAMADRAYLFEEIEQIDRVLAHAYGLSPVEAAKMRATCETAARDLPDDVDLARIILKSVDYAHRLEAVTALWSVANADGITDEREAELVELVEDSLGISRADSEAARAAAVIP